MNDAFEISAVALNTQQRALDVIASNVANVNTPAFKRSSVRFVDLLTTQADPSNPKADLSGLTHSAGVTSKTITSVDDPGQIKHTGRALDIAISGSGFIELLGPQGKSLLWRGGSLSIQDDGLLSTIDGIPLRGMIGIPADASEIRIDHSGIVSALVPDNNERRELGRIDLVRALSADGMKQLEGGFFELQNASATERVTAGEEGSAYFVQGGLEQSNVNMNDEMVQLMIIQRSYAANAQVVQAADQLASINNNLRK
jgi:flagellar basal-body rod protein FlgG